MKEQKKIFRFEFLCFIQNTLTKDFVKKTQMVTGKYPAKNTALCGHKFIYQKSKILEIVLKSFASKSSVVKKKGLFFVTKWPP